LPSPKEPAVTVNDAPAALADFGSTWAQRRLRPDVLHFDSASAGRPSEATLDAVGGYARREAVIGASVAYVEAADVITRLRTDLAEQFGVTAEGIALTESATNAFRTLLRVWPLPAGARVAVVPAEWGPNLEDLAAAGHTLVPLAADGEGAVDLAALEQLLRTARPDVVLLTQVASHRTLVQPVAAAVALCRAADVPVWVDSAQAIGHIDTATGADAMFAPARKWLAGPRGVGVLAVAARHLDSLRVPSAALLPDASPMQLVSSHEAHMAGRIGLANALREYLADGPTAVRTRLAQVGEQTRAALADVAGWTVVGAGNASALGAITALRATGDVRIADARAELLQAHGILTIVCVPARAPGDMTEPLLRVSPHVDCSAADLDRLATALRAVV
jgi:pyridoxal 5-phosphate dependent beta-lyase